MKVFDGRAATEEYMSTHSLTFSTPEMTLKKFVFWLSEIVEHNGEEVPRLILFLQTRKEENEDQRKAAIEHNLRVKEEASSACLCYISCRSCSSRCRLARLAGKSH